VIDSESTHEFECVWWNWGPKLVRWGQTHQKSEKTDQNNSQTTARARKVDIPLLVWRLSIRHPVFATLHCILVRIFFLDCQFRLLVPLFTRTDRPLEKVPSEKFRTFLEKSTPNLAVWDGTPKFGCICEWKIVENFILVTNPASVSNAQTTHSVCCHHKGTFFSWFYFNPNVIGVHQHFNREVIGEANRYNDSVCRAWNISFCSSPWILHGQPDNRSSAFKGPITHFYKQWTPLITMDTIYDTFPTFTQLQHPHNQRRVNESNNHW
jgi:hypothetical protein